MYSKTVAICLALLVAGGEASKPLLQSQAPVALMAFERFVNLGETANVNEYIDNAVPHLVEFIRNNGLDPMPLPDLEEGFSYKPLLITYSARLLLDNGRLTNLVSMKRDGDAMISYFAKMLRMRVELGFNDLEFEYNYLAKLMNMGPTGGIYGSLNRLSVEIDVLFDFNNDELHLQHFALSDIGRLRVRLSGNFLTDWFVSPVVAVFSRIFDSTILKYVEDNIRVVIQEEIEKFNANVREILNNLE